MNLSVEAMLLCIISAGFLSIIYGYFTGKHILNSSPGNAKMQEIASAIQLGAKAYLNRQYKTIAIVGLVVLLIISYLFSILVGVGYLIGAVLSGLAGYVGMLVSVQANVKHRTFIKNISFLKKIKITRIGKILNSRHKNSIVDRNGHQIKINYKGYFHTFD